MLFIFILEERISYHKVDYAIHRAEEIDKCRARAWEGYGRDWDDTCIANNRLPECTMESTQSQPINDRLSKEYDRCYKQY